jgi:hypothetical protein
MEGIVHNAQIATVSMAGSASNRFHLISGQTQRGKVRHGGISSIGPPNRARVSPHKLRQPGSKALITVAARTMRSPGCSGFNGRVNHGGVYIVVPASLPLFSNFRILVLRKDEQAADSKGC